METDVNIIDDAKSGEVIDITQDGDTSGDAAKQHEPPPDHPRFKEIYGKC